MEADLMLPGPWFGIFLPNLLFYFVFLAAWGKESWKKIILGLFGGMAFILNFINTIASTTRLLNHYSPTNIIVAQMFMLVVVINALASVSFGIFTIGLFLSKKMEWVRIVGLIGAILSMTGGFPLAIYSAFYFGDAPGFSMFFMASVISTLTFFVPLLPSLWKKFTEPRNVVAEVKSK